MSKLGSYRVSESALQVFGGKMTYSYTTISLFFKELLRFGKRNIFRKKLFDIVPIAGNQVIESITDGIVVLDLKDRIVDMNPSAKVTFQGKVNIGYNAIDYFKDWPDLKDELVNQNKFIEFEQVENEDIRCYQASILPIKNDREVLLGKLLIIRDVTEKNMAEKELLLKKREIAVKEERERMARELHDNLGQILGFVNVQTQAIREYLKQGDVETVVQCLERLAEVSQLAQHTVKETIHTIRVSETNVKRKNSNLFSELKQQLNLFEKSYGISTELENSLGDDFELNDSGVLLQIIYIVKEALNNIMKHSHASNVKMRMEEGLDGVTVSVIDNGSGFNLISNDSDRKEKYGLLFMNERAREMGGYLEVFSKVGKGTVIKIFIPIQHLKKCSE